MFFAIVLAAATAAPACTPLQSLTPQQTIVGRAYDAERAWTRRPITPESVVMSMVACRWERSDESEAQRVKRALSFGCEKERTAIIGRVSARRFVLTPERYYVFGEYDVTVEQLVTPIGHGAPIEPESTITVYRDGGAVCAPEGELRATNREQAPFEIGGRYLMFLTAIGSGFKSSEFDWTLNDRARRARLAHIDHVDETVDVTGSELVSTLRTIERCQ